MNPPPYKAQFVGGPYDDLVLGSSRPWPFIYQVPLPREITLGCWIEEALIRPLQMSTFDYEATGTVAPGVVAYYPVSRWRGHPLMAGEPQRCSCGHGPDDICVEGAVYESCGHEACGGGCTYTGECRGGPRCCDTRRRVT